MRDLQANGLEFEHYDMPGVSWDGDVATMEGMGHAAWFRTARAKSCVPTTRRRAEHPCHVLVGRGPCSGGWTRNLERRLAILKRMIVEWRPLSGFGELGYLANAGVAKAANGDTCQLFSRELDLTCQALADVLR